MDRIIVPFETKSISETGSFSGYGSIFGNIDLGLDIIEKGTFKETLEQHKSDGTMPAMRYEHDYTPVGEYSEMSEDNIGLALKGQLWTPNNPLGRIPTDAASLAYNIMQTKSKKGFSVGFITESSRYETKEFIIPRGQNKGEKRDMEVRIISKAHLEEVSFTSSPMNESAVLLDVKSENITIRDLENVLKTFAGLTGQEAKSVLASGFSGLMRDAESYMRDAEQKEIDTCLDIINNW